MLFRMADSINVFSVRFIPADMYSELGTDGSQVKLEAELHPCAAQLLKDKTG